MDYIYYIIGAIFLLLAIICNSLLWINKREIIRLEKKLIILFKKRSNKIVSLFFPSKNHIIKHNEIFDHYISLKRKEAYEALHIDRLDRRINTYTKMHSEINFILKVCEKHEKLKKNAVYNYTKEQILETSSHIGELYDNYKKRKSTYKKLAFIGKLTLIGFFIGK